MALTSYLGENRLSYVLSFVDCLAVAACILSYYLAFAQEARVSPVPNSEEYRLVKFIAWCVLNYNIDEGLPDPVSN